MTRPDTGVEVREHIEVEFAGDTIVAGVVRSAKAGDHVSIPKRFHAALLDALAREAGAVEAKVERAGLHRKITRADDGNAFLLEAGKYLVIPLEDE